MEIRRAEQADLETILGIYERARAFMREHGNPGQWGSSYPGRALVEESLGNTWLCVEDGQVACVFCYAEQPEADDTEIAVQWCNEEPYAVVHRLASAGTARGAAQFCLEWALRRAGNLRLDTHKNNLPMQNLLKKCGFIYCGSFSRLGTGMDWLAYQSVRPRARPAASAGR